MPTNLELCAAFIDAHPDEAARTLERLLPAQTAALLEALAPETAAVAVSHLMPGAAADCLAQVAAERTRAIVALLSADRVAALLRQAGETMKAAIIERLPSGESEAVLAMLRHADDTAGALMDPRVLASAAEVSASVALARLRRSPRHIHDYVYVVDDGHRLTGVVSLRDLVIARPGDPLTAIVTRSIGRIPATAGPAAILNHSGWERFHALPVVDDAGVLLGAIRDQARRALEEKRRANERPQDAISTVFALGELYWLGLSGVVDGLATAVRRAARPGASSGGPGVTGGETWR